MRSYKKLNLINISDRVKKFEVKSAALKQFEGFQLCMLEKLIKELPSEVKMTSFKDL